MNVRIVVRSAMVILAIVGTMTIAPAQPANTPDWSLVHTKTMEGIDSLYSFQFRAAEARFNEVIRMAPQDPRGYFFKAMISYYRFELMRVEADYDRFLMLADTVIDVTEKILDDNEKNSTALFYLGGIYGYRGMIKGDKDEILSAVWDGRKGYGYLREALEVDPKNYDAQMGLGLFNYLVSRLPKAFRWVATAIGFDADRELGLRMLERVAAKGLYARGEAHWWLSQFYQMEEQPEKGAQHLKVLADQYPSNPFYVQQYGYLLLFSLHRIDEAMPLFQRAITMTNHEAERYIIQGYYRLGHAYRFKNQFNDAIPLYTKYLTLERTDTSRIQGANYYLGLCYELSGDRQTALTYYQKAPRLSKEWLTKPMTPFDIEKEKMSSSFSAGYYAEGYEEGSTLLARRDLTDDQRGDVLWKIASSYSEQKDYAKAAVYYAQITGLTIKDKTYMLPNSFYQLGLCYVHNGQKDLAKTAFKKALEFEKYEYEDRIREWAEEELEKLED